MDNNRRKHILDIMKDEKNEIRKQLKSQSQYQHQPQINRPSPLQSESEQYDNPAINAGSATLDSQQLQTYTFNKFHNSVLQDQMRLSKQEVENNQRYIYRDMAEQNQEEEEEEEDDELGDHPEQMHDEQQEQQEDYDGENEEGYDEMQQDVYQHQGPRHYQNVYYSQEQLQNGDEQYEGEYVGDQEDEEVEDDGQEHEQYQLSEEELQKLMHEREMEYFQQIRQKQLERAASNQQIYEEDAHLEEEPGEFEQQQDEDEEGAYDEEYNEALQFQRDEHKRQEQYMQQPQMTGNWVSESQQQPKKYYISDQPATAQNHQPPYQRNQQMATQPKSGNKLSGKSSARELKDKLASLKQQRDQRQKEAISARIQALAQKKSEHVFHPQCKLSAEQELRRNAIHKDPLTEEEKYSAWLRLYDDKKQTYEERKELKEQIEEYKLQRDCYTTPKINENSVKIAAFKNNGNNIPVEDRLNQQAVMKKMKLSLQQEKRKQQEVEACSFHPEILEQETAIDYVPLHERFTEIAKKKQEILHQLRIKEQIETNTTFHPSINPKSAIIADSKINIKDVSERLNLDFHEQQQRKTKLQTTVNEDVYKECRFQPQTNPISSLITKTLPLFDGNSDVVERQEIMDKQTRDRKFRIAQEVESSNQCSFKPKINYISELLVTENQGRLMETQAQKIDRLSNQEVEKRKFKASMRQTEQEQANTFTPSINQVSKILTADKPRNLDDLAYNYTGKAHILLLQEEKLNEEMRNCSFYPSLTTSSRYSHVPAYYNQEKCEKSVKIETVVKERKLREQKKQMMAKELEGCTFKPVVNSAKVIDKEQQIQKVKGLENFLQNKDKAQKQKAEKLLKEDLLFNLHKRYDPEEREKTTTPVPFNLSHNYRPNLLSQH